MTKRILRAVPGYSAGVLVDPDREDVDDPHVWKRGRFLFMPHAYEDAHNLDDLNERWKLKKKSEIAVGRLLRVLMTEDELKKLIREVVGSNNTPNIQAQMDKIRESLTELYKDHAELSNIKVQLYNTQMQIENLARSMQALVNSHNQLVGAHNALAEATQTPQRRETPQPSGDWRNEVRESWNKRHSK